MRRMTRLMLLIMVVLVYGALTAIAAEPPTEPILRIDPGMHTAVIRRIAVDDAGRFLVTASDDKSLRVWELPTGRLVRTIRPPIGEGNEGKLYSVAISPDGITIAAGGWTQFNDGKSNVADDGGNIYLFDRVNGNMTGRITGLPDAIFHLAFSPDGEWLAATQGSEGVRVYRTSDWYLVAKDTEYGAASYSAHFYRDGRLVTTCNDGFVRLYVSETEGWGTLSGGQIATLTPLRKVKAPDENRPFAARFSPDGAKIAVGYNDTAKVSMLSGRDLSDPVTLSDSGVNGSLVSITWSSDGVFLFAGGQYRKQIDGVRTLPIRRWSDEGRGKFIDIPASRDTIMDLVPLPDGGVAFGGATPDFGVVSPHGKRNLLVSPANADFRAVREGFLVANDGTRIRFGFELFGTSPALFDLTTRQLTLGGDSAALTAPVTKLTGVEVTDWEDTYTPKLNGVALKLETYEKSFSLALAPDSASFVTGTHWYLHCFDRKGQELWRTPAPEVVWSVNIPANGAMVVAAFGDGIIRWYRLKDGKELLAFFPHADRKRWVLWTPSGYYDASVGGEDLIGWQVNRGKDKAADFFPASRFRDTYYRPDIVAKVLATLDEAEAVRLANAARGIAKGAPDIKTILPPVVELLDLPDGTLTTDTTSVTLRYRVRSDAPVTKVSAKVNARPAPTPKGTSATVGDKDIREITVAIPEEDCEIALIAENRNAPSVPAIVRVRWKGEKTAKMVKPRLIILAVGINEYQDPSVRKLRYAAKDADDFLSAFKPQEGLLYSNVVSRVIPGSHANREAILKGLVWLKKETTNKDIAAIFLSGHGGNDPEGRYYFLPQNGRADELEVTGLDLSAIKNTISALPGKALLFLDTCRAGNVDLNGIINMLTSYGVGAVVFASSTSAQQSWEREDWKNGAFTKALVEGLTGKAAGNMEGRITVSTLETYVSDRVKELTAKQQTPVVGKPLIADFPLAIKKAVLLEPGKPQ